MDDDSLMIIKRLVLAAKRESADEIDDKWAATHAFQTSDSREYYKTALCIYPASNELIEMVFAIFKTWNDSAGVEHDELKSPENGLED